MLTWVATRTGMLSVTGMVTEEWVVKVTRMAKVIWLTKSLCDPALITTFSSYKNSETDRRAKQEAGERTRDTRKNGRKDGYHF